MSAPHILRIFPVKRLASTILSATVCLASSLSLRAASDVTISTSATTDGSFSGTNPVIFTPTGSPANIEAATVVTTYLSAGKSVTISTASTSTGNGDLTVSSSLAKSGSVSTTLRLEADRDLIINAPISTSLSSLPIHLVAGRNMSTTHLLSTGSADMTVNVSQTLTLGAGISVGTGRLLSFQSGTVRSLTPITLTGNVSSGSSSKLHLSGTVTGSLAVGGRISPGTEDSVGGLQVNGAATLQSTATTVIELGGTATSSYDRITSNSILTVGGALEVRLVNNFHNAISGGSVFTVLQGLNRTGTFTGLANGSRINLPGGMGSMRINYTTTAVTLDQWRPVSPDLAWDPGILDEGTQVYTQPSAAPAGRYYFKVTKPVTDIGAWRARLTVTSGEASLYLRQTSEPTTSLYTYRSIQTGSDGVTVKDTSSTATWYVMVDATEGALWTLFAGQAFVHELGSLPYTDANGNSQYDPGEPVSPQVVLSSPMPPEGMRLFKVTVPLGTPAWSLGLQGSTREIAMKPDKVPFPDSSSDYTLKQPGRMLVIDPTLVGGSSYYLSVTAPPGEMLGLDSRIQEIEDVPYNGMQVNVGMSNGPYRVYRTQVPVQQIAWDVSTTPTSGNPDLSVRKGNIGSELRNDAISEAPGDAKDSVTLVPNYLTDGTWYITVGSSTPCVFTLDCRSPTITPINFTDQKINDEPARAGWRYYALTDIPAQTSALGWDLVLSNQVPGTRIAIRRNKVPGRWDFRNASTQTTVSDVGKSYLDEMSIGGNLQRPGQVADIWYVGVYMPQQALGPFTLTARPMPAPVLDLNGGNAAVTEQPASSWRYFTVTVPDGIVGWDLRIKEYTGGRPRLVVRRDLLPNYAVFHSGGSSSSNLSSSASWPSGDFWAGRTDWTERHFGAAGSDKYVGDGLVMGTGRPLRPGTYYIGVYNEGEDEVANLDDQPVSYTLESRGIGAGQIITPTDLPFAGGAATITNLPPREAAYFKVTVPAGTPSWEITLQPSVGEMMLAARRGTVPDFGSEEGGETQSTNFGSFEAKVQKIGADRYVILPHYNGAGTLIPGDYYLAVVSEGVDPPSSGVIGNGGVSGTLTSHGHLAVAPMGTATSNGLSENVSLVGGQIKAYSFTVPAGAPSLEVRLDNRVGNPVMSVIRADRIPTPPDTYSTSAGSDYGFEGGAWHYTEGAGPWSQDNDLITLPNPLPGTYHLVVRAAPTGDGRTFPDAAANIVVVANLPAPQAFNSTATVSGQPYSAWRYFQVTVPAGVLGWDVKVKDISGGTPKLFIRRDLVPESQYSRSGDNWVNTTTWPTGEYLSGTVDWTQRDYDTTAQRRRYTGERIVTAMGRPLQPGTYYVGVYNDGYDPVNGLGEQPTTYTLESRGIGSGQVIPVNDLTWSGGTATTEPLPPREAAYYKISIPANTSSWEMTLDPSQGEMLTVIGRDALPNLYSREGEDLQSASGKRTVKVQKTGPERYVLLPPEGSIFLVSGDYYVAVVSEGVNPPDSTVIGTGTAVGTITSRGPLEETTLGTASTTGLSQQVSLVGAQIKAYQFTVLAGTPNLEVRLDNRVGVPWMSILRGDRLPQPSMKSNTGDFQDYGFGGGQGATFPDDGTWKEASTAINLSNPLPGTYHLMVRASSTGSGNTFPDASATLIVTGNGAVPLAFNGGTSTVTGHPADAWRYFLVTVPIGVSGWDLRIRNATGGRPTLVVRRDMAPDKTTNELGGGWYYPETQTSWPSGASWIGTTDWTGLQYGPDTSSQRTVSAGLVMGMGRPLESGTYWVGVYNDGYDVDTNLHGLSSNYSLESRGIGMGQILPATELNFTGGTTSINQLAPREAMYFKIAIPANTSSWEFSLNPSVGEMLVAVRRGAVPDFASQAGGAVQSAAAQEAKIQKAGPERYVMLPPSGASYLAPGDYYVAVVSEGDSVPGSGRIGSAPSSGTFISHGPLAVTPLGTVDSTEITQPVNLVASQIKAYSFIVPPGSKLVEVRLTNREGNPWMSLLAGSSTLPAAPDLRSNRYGSEGGNESGITGWRQDDESITLVNPPAGPCHILVRASTSYYNVFPAASANLTVQAKPLLALNFDASLNGNGHTNTDSRQLSEGSKAFYEVAVPKILGGEPVLGWIVRADFTQGSGKVKVSKVLGADSSAIELEGRTAVLVPPFFDPGQTWYVEVEAQGLASYTVTSAPVTLSRPVWSMPTGHNQAVGDTGLDSSGTPLPGDGGTDLGQDDWHFYAIDVPEGNAGLLRTELRTLNGDPNLYIREDGIPTIDHGGNGEPYGSLYHRRMSDTVSEAGNWVPLDGRKEKQLRPGRWYLGVKAEGGSNARYRLMCSTGQVTDLAISGGSAVNQILQAKDWRYYRFTVPMQAPKEWKITFGQSVGDVKMWLRDTVPPGSAGSVSWKSDNKNQGPYSEYGHDVADTYTFTTPPLRPGHVYYAGFTTNVSSSTSADAIFDVTSAVGAETIGEFPVLDFHTGNLNLSLPGGASVVYRIPVPAIAARLRWTSTHTANVKLRMEQGTLPGESGSQHWTSGTFANAPFDYVLGRWPFVAGQDYYLRVTNTSSTAETLALILQGTDGLPGDGDSDGLPDSWEQLYFIDRLQYGGSDDPDGDGATNAVEFADGTIPNVASSAKYTLLTPGFGGAGLRTPHLPRYDRGTAVTLTNAPEFGYTFLGWQRVGDYSNNFALRATGLVTVPVTDTYTFGTHAADGVRLRVNNVEIISDSVPHGAQDRFGQISLAAGSYVVELTAFEGTGQKALELFSVPGAFSSFNTSFKLVGDTAAGGLPVQTVEGSSRVPGFSVRQASQPVPSPVSGVYGFYIMDDLLSGVKVARADLTMVAPTINYRGSTTGEGHFPSSIYFPLQQLMAPTATLPWTVLEDATVAALHTLPLTDVLEAPGLIFTTTDDSPWLGENSTQSDDHLDRARNGPIVHNQASTLNTTVVGPGTLSFRWKVSSQAGADLLQFRSNGVVVQQISGETAWTTVTYNVPAGSQQISWRYVKDGTVSEGADTGWLDKVNWLPAGGYASWLASYFTSTDMADPLVTSALADYDQDGTSNLMEFATGMNPKSAAESAPTAISTDTGGLKVTYRRSKNAVTAGLVFAVEWSDTLSPTSWQSTGVTETFADQGTYDLVTAIIPMGTGTSRFARLKVAQ